MVPYFPFPSTFDLKMGTAPLPGGNQLVEMDQHYGDEIALKRKILEEDHPYYYQASSSTHTAQWEVLEKILSGLAVTYPDHFTFRKNGTEVYWKNNLLSEEKEFIIGDTSTLPYEPLDWVGRQIQEDLIILDAKSHLVAGQLCFPSGWCLKEKFEKHFLAVHAPLPSVLYPMLQAADKLIERIPVNKPIARTNWGFRVCDQLDISSKHGQHYRTELHQVASELNKENTGDKIFFRIERQTLSRLPQSGSILFTIHTYYNKVKDEATDPARASAMLSFLKTVPAELLEYKLMIPLIKPLIAYLESVQ